MRRGVPWFHGEGGGIAIILLIILMVLAFPVSIAAVSIAGQLSHNAPVYDNLLVQPYSAGGGVEHAAWEIRQDPNFNEGLIPSSPSRQRTIISNGQDVLVTTTRDFTLPTLRGQGLVVARKTVTPTTAPANIASEFTYTIAIKNEGSETVMLEQVVDFLPPGFSYLPGSTTGITAADPTNPSTPGSGVTTSVLYLNDAGALPYPWQPAQGSDAREGTITPDRNTWTLLPQYWDAAPLGVSGVLPATTWRHTQQLQTARSNNQWRWTVQVLRGGVVAFQFTSAAADAPTTWAVASMYHNPGDIATQAGDRLRLFVEVWSNRSSSSDRRFDYRWGGAEGYVSRTKVPDLDTGCVGPTQKLTWELPSPIGIQVQETQTLTFRATAAPPSGVYYDQVRVRYRPWWATEAAYVYSPYTAPVTVGDGGVECGYNLELLVSKQVTDRQILADGNTLVTYTIALENVTLNPIPVHRIEDVLPPGFDYVAGSARGITTAEPNKSCTDPAWVPGEPCLIRWRLIWGNVADGPPAFTVLPGETKTLVFRARGIVAPGAIYYNDVRAGIGATGLQGATADIVLVFDVSGSIGSGIVELKDAANQLIDAFSLSTTRPQVRIGLVVFRGFGYVAVPMTDVDDHPFDIPLHDGINNRSFGEPLGGGTNFVDALFEAGGDDGAGGTFGGAFDTCRDGTVPCDRPDAENLIIFITHNDPQCVNNSDPNCSEDPAVIAAASTATGDTVFVVGVNNARQRFFEAIASDPDDENIFYAEEFSSLLALLDALVRKVLAAASGVITTEGGTPSTAVSGGTLYDITALTEDGTIVQSRVYLQWDNRIEVLSWQIQ